METIKFNTIQLLSKRYLMLFLVIILFSCNDQSFVQGYIAPVTTSAITEITTSSAIGGGIVNTDEGGAIIARGICWSMSGNPTVALTTKTINGSGKGSFTSNIWGLSPNTTYYVRAYATNNAGITAYGKEVRFSTIALGVPALTTTVITNITSSAAISGGSISSDGGDYITARGVCWSTANNPTVALTTKTNDGTGMGDFASAITGLIQNTTYYVRAYATNSVGTTYGNVLSFTSPLPTIPSLTTGALTNITSTTAISGGLISSDGGKPITSRGVCWSTTNNPTIALSTKTNNGSGIGSFSSTVSGLTAYTTYYVRAYATNNIGTAYGDILSFKTGGTVTDINGNVYNTVVIGNQIWMKENLNVSKYRNGDAIPQLTNWQNKTTGVWCYYGNNSSNGNVYGKLYNWYAVHDPRGLAPTGWHVASQAEYTTLITYLGGIDVAGGKMKATTLWNSPNTDATNSSGFTALPGSFALDGVSFYNVGYSGEWWSSSENDVANAWIIYLGHNLGNVGNFYYDKRGGKSVRCVKD